MTRTVHASVITELAKDDFTMVSLLAMHFSTVVRITDAQFDLVYDANTYSSDENLIQIGDVSESSEIRVGSINVTFGGADQTYISMFLNNDYVDVRVQYWKAFLDDSFGIIGDPLLMFDGYIGAPKIDERDGVSKMTIEAASHWANFDMKVGRKTNDNSQQAVFSGDTGMEYASHTIRDIRWGRK